MLRAARITRRQSTIVDFAGRQLWLACLSFIATLSSRLDAQSIRQITGSVVSVTNTAVAGAQISVQNANGTALGTQRTDSAGRFRLSLSGASVPLLVKVQALGYKPYRTVIQSNSDSSGVAQVRVVLERVPLLDAISVKEWRRPLVFPSETNRSSIDDYLRELDVAVTATGDSRGGPLATASLQPGFRAVLNPAGQPSVSAFGLSTASNKVSLQGLGVTLTRLPRLGISASHATTSPYDVSRGGFSGAEVALTAPIATEEQTLYVAHSLRTDFSSEGIEGRIPSALQLDGAASGRLPAPGMYFNAAWEMSLGYSTIASVAGGSEAAFPAIADSLAGLRAALGDKTGGQIPAAVAFDRTMESSWLVRLDHNPFYRQGSSIILAMNQMTTPLVPGSVGAPVAQSQLKARELSAIAIQRSVLGRYVTNETSIALEATATDRTSKTPLPSGTVLITPSAQSGLEATLPVGFGGSGQDGARLRTVSLEGRNTSWWASKNGAHEIKLSEGITVHRFKQISMGGAEGTFVFQSIADFMADRAASYSAPLLAPTQEVRAVGASVALGDSWRATERLRLQYGVRTDLTRVSPSFSAVLDTAEIANDVARRLALTIISPRLGFDYTLGDRTLEIEGFRSGEHNHVFGGIGRFSDVFHADNTMVGGRNGIEHCLDVHGVLWVTPPSNQNFVCHAAGPVGLRTISSSLAYADASLRPQSSWRTNLGWDLETYSGVNVRTQLNAAFNENQSSVVDATLPAQSSFNLISELNRPVFALPADIDTTGQVLPRRTDTGSTIIRAANDRSRFVQFQIGVGPASVFRRQRLELYYVWNNEQVLRNGYSESTAGDPRVRSWHRGPTPTHQITVSLGIPSPGVNFALLAQVSSGVRFTPLAGSDVNADGLANDRVFVEAQHIQALERAGAAGRALDCLRSQVGRIAEPMSCEGPWTLMTNLRIGSRYGASWLPKRLQMALTVRNAAAGLDRLMNGNQSRGWGGGGIVDPTALEVRGFQPQDRAFSYLPNANFGRTVGSATFPPGVVLEGMWDVGPSQAATLLADVRRAGPDLGRIVESFQRNNFNPFAIFDRVGDSLDLSIVQTELLQQARQGYNRDLSAIWQPVADDVRDAAIPISMQRDRVREAQHAAVDATRAAVVRIRGILRPDQLRRLPRVLYQLYDPRAYELAKIYF